ncbi:YdcF family protein [Chelativorans sp. AA-79]|uniref:YdcF family protein n=1 Tax=Chelativorans sp. AA-79 TaxID=3028735 RepID=UPI0023F68FCE|nr:YdcF family protein [Chelativorans sp. AA-79]WEX11727.1 YdcF family protein [Chelativorans sp. AA-79]
MFHLASAVFWTVVQPFNLVGLLIAAAVVAALIRWRKLSITLGTLAFLVVALAGWTTFGALLLHPLEGRFQRPDPAPQHVDGIVVLGGGFEGAVNLSRGGYELNDSGDRFVEAAILARRYPQARVLISGGSGSVFLAGEGDADTAPRLLTGLGVPPERIELEDESRDTFENARLSFAMAKPRPGEMWLLVTSAFHMPRAVGAFRQAGFDVVPWPADYKTTGRERPGLTDDNVLDSLRNTSIAVREWIGLAAYRLMGRSSAILPALEGGDPAAPIQP